MRQEGDSRSPVGLTFDLEQHLVVVRELFDEVEQALDGFLGLVAGEAAADQVDLVQHVLGHDELLAAGAGAEDIDRGEEILLGDAAIEHELHVAGAFKLLEDKFICLGVCLHEGSCEDGEGAGSLRIAGSGKETARHFQGTSDDTAGLVATTAALALAATSAAITTATIIGTGESGDGVHEQEDVLTSFNKALGSLDA